jgi:hypothetical protein
MYNVVLLVTIIYCYCYSSRQHIPDLAIYFLNGWAYDISPTVNLIELGKTHLLVLDTLS